MEHDITLRGFGLRLEPLAQAHVTALADMLGPQMWAGMTVPLPETDDLMGDYVDAAIATPGRAAFAVLGDDGEVRGSTSLYEWVPAQDRAEIGSTFYARRFWGGATNPACKYLLLDYAFETAGLFRVALRADARNSRSLAAIERLGATREGVLRGHRVDPVGERSDTVYFSILAPEWPAVRAGLLERLA